MRKNAPENEGQDTSRVRQLWQSDGRGPLRCHSVIHKHSHHLEKEPRPVYDTAEQIQTMPACKAVLVERGPCYVRLRTADGNGFFIGSPAACADVVQFLKVLKDGRTYKFPETFQKYQEQRRPAWQ
jgi:hypothetical protein